MPCHALQAGSQPPMALARWGGRSPQGEPETPPPPPPPHSFLPVHHSPWHFQFQYDC